MGALAVNLALALGAGVLTALSPCVLPALPLVVGSALAGHRYGPVALAAGLASAFAAVGVALAASGSIAGLDESGLRRLAAVLLIAGGAALLSVRLQDAMSRVTSPLASGAAKLSTRLGGGLGGQFAIGALLGAVWSPCVGPTLGAAIGLASAAGTQSLLLAAALMFAFGIGSSLPLLATAYLSRHMLAARPILLGAGATGKLALGAVLICVGGLTLSGLDKQIEAALLQQLPQWWIGVLAGA
jgi:cytochrome c biogenesis protein CcdA